MTRHTKDMKKETKETRLSLDLTEARKFLVDITPQAGEILKRHFNTGGYLTRQNGVYPI